MRKLMIVGAVALVLFMISAAVSLYLCRMTEPPAASLNVPAAPEPKTEAPTLSPHETPTREQQETLRRREIQLGLRQKQLEMIQHNIARERIAIEDLRRSLASEARVAADKVAEAERRFQDLEHKRKDNDDQLADLKKSQTEFDVTETDRIKQMSAMYDAMPPEDAAKILQNLLDTGNGEVAAKILAGMKERQAARVLAELRDPAAAAQLLGKLRGLKRPTTLTTPALTAPVLSTPGLIQPPKE